MCGACPHRLPCSSRSKVRAGKVPLNRVEFKLVPPSLGDISDPEDVHAIYKSCYGMVFPNHPPDYPGKIQGFSERVKALADEAECSVKMFILCLMVAKKSVDRDGRFFATACVGKNSPRLVEQFRLAVKDRYGVFDTFSLGSFADDKHLAHFKQKLMASEVLMGHWILGFKIANAGDPVKPFFSTQEYRLDPIWLCLEQSYGPYHDSTEALTAEIAKHRSAVHLAYRQMRKNKKMALSYFEVRQSMMKEVVAEVLHRRGYQPDDFECPPVVTDVVKFWSRLALAIQHIDCLRFLGVTDA